MLTNAAWITLAVAFFPRASLMLVDEYPEHGMLGPLAVKG